MKFVIGAAAAAFLLAASPALAQTSMSPNCTGFEPAPTLPDGATADRAAVEAMNTQLQAWAEARATKVRACQADINAMTQAANAAVQEHGAVTTAWNAEVAEFNARGNTSSRRERGGTLTRPDHQ